MQRFADRQVTESGIIAIMGHQGNAGCFQLGGDPNGYSSLILPRNPPASPRERVAMVGDGLYTDILGGLAAGLGTVLVTDHGLLKGLDWQATGARTGIVPDYVVPAA